MHHLAAIDVDGLSGDILRVIGGQEDGHSGTLFGRLPAPERRDFGYFSQGPCSVILARGSRKVRLAPPPNRFIQIRFPHSRRESIRPDAMGSEGLRRA